MKKFKLKGDFSFLTPRYFQRMMIKIHSNSDQIYLQLLNSMNICLVIYF